MRDGDAGVPEALPETLRHLRERMDPAAVDRLWIFPPRVRGRKEWGLVVVAAFMGGSGEGEGSRRRLFTARYAAERTGRGAEVSPLLKEEGVAPEDRFHRVIAGVMRRSEEELGDPEVVHVGGRPEAFGALLDRVGPPRLGRTDDE